MASLVRVTNRVVFYEWAMAYNPIHTAMGGSDRRDTKNAMIVDGVCLPVCMPVIDRERERVREYETLKTWMCGLNVYSL